MIEEKTVKIDVLDLLISVLQDYEKTMSELIGELHLAVQKLNDILDREDKRTETMLRYYEETQKVKR